jgi:glutathione S-transferase
MIERVIKATASGWRPWAIGAALSMAGAALLLFLKRRAASHTDADDIYEAWWRHREKVRANGNQPPTTGQGNEGNVQLFV